MKRVIAGLLLIALSGCRHTVEVKAPEEPITINLNVKIEHEIPCCEERLEPHSRPSNYFTGGHPSTLPVAHHGPFKGHEVSRVAISPRLESLPLPSTHEANPTTSRRQTQVGIVDSQ